jgi:replicative DNA helicase Mcm|tara:strand:- start:10083 stop:12047 length:1965 start_codon:yes stop_codon:yes gene_type:complete
MITLDDMTESAQVEMICDELYKTSYVDVIDGLRPNSTFCVDTTVEPFLSLYSDSPQQFLDVLRKSIIQVITSKRGKSKYEIIKSAYNDLVIKPVSGNVMSMHDITSKHENTTVTFKCQIIAIDSPKTYIKNATFVCPSCNSGYYIECNIDRKISVPYCLNVPCRRAKTEVDSTTVVTDDVQTILMQEFMDESKNNSPVILTGKLIGRNIRTSFVGQRKLITGLFRSLVDLKESENDVFIDILCLDDLEEQNPIIPSKDELKKLIEDTSKESFISDLVGSFAPNIYGYGDVKLAILLELVGGVKTNKRGDINTLLVGDPSMAKSELLKFAQKVTQRSIYTSGRGSSAAGLTIGMVKMPDGRLVAQAGVLPICNNGFAFIDEFDKMNKDDRSSMHEAMEQQTVSIAKAGIQMTLPTRTAILAAANPKYGIYDSDITLRDNIDVPAPLLSRFDMIWLIRDKVHRTEDIKKATHILDSFTNGIVSSYLTDVQLMAFLNYARSLKPKLLNESKSKLLEIYEQMRNSSSESKMPVGIRQLEALVRMSMAYAKLNLKESVTIDDVQSVERLIKIMYEGFGQSLDKQSVQQQIYFDKKNTKQHDLLSIWNGCKDANGNVRLNVFQKTLLECGMSEDETKRLIDRWENNNVIKLNKDGSYKRI